MNIYVSGQRAFLAGEYSRARRYHRPSAQAWQRLRDRTTTELLAEDAAARLADIAVANEAQARLRHERLKTTLIVIAAIIACIGAALPFAIPVLQ